MNDLKDHIRLTVDAEYDREKGQQAGITFSEVGAVTFSMMLYFCILQSKLRDGL